jgi:hypothetical protein
LANLEVAQLSNLLVNGGLSPFFGGGGRSGGTAISVIFQREPLSNHPKNACSAPKREGNIG